MEAILAAMCFGTLEKRMDGKDKIRNDLKLLDARHWVQMGVLVSVVLVA